MVTAVPAGSGLAPKKWSDALMVQSARKRTAKHMLTGPMPQMDKSGKVLRRQTVTDMPIVHVTDLAKGPGDTVRVDCANIIKMAAVMGDENAEGLGASLDFSFRDIRIDMATIPVSAGGTMTQKRMQHELRLIALQQLKGGLPSFEWQRDLVAMAGARGIQDDTSWILPLSTDPRFLRQMVNAPRAPTFNRHYVVSGNTLVQGGQQLANVISTDVLKLSHCDDLAEILQEAAIRIMPVKIPDDAAADDDPIKAIVLHDALSWSRLIRETTVGYNLRQFQTDAMTRATYGNLKAHPLFAPGSFIWNNILHRRIGDFNIRFLAGTVTNIIPAANRYTAVETPITVNAGLGAGFQVARTIVLGAQALGSTSGANADSGGAYTMLEHTTNFGRNLEMAGELIGASDKMTYAMPDGLGNYEPTDIGVIVVDSVVPRLTA